MPPENAQTQPTDTPTNPIGPNEAPGQPVPPQVPSGSPASGKSKWPLIVAVVVVVLVIAGAATYFFALKPDSQPSTSNNKDSSLSTTESQDETSTVTSIATTNSPNDQNGTISFAHPASWQVTKETDQYGAEETTIKSALGNAVKMYRRDSVGGACEPDNDTYTLVKKLTTENSSYIFSEYEAPASAGSQALRLEPNYDKKAAAHKALTEGQSNTGVCQNLASYSIAKDINVTVKNSSGDEARYNDIKSDTDFIAMLQSFTVTDN